MADFALGTAELGVQINLAEFDKGISAAQQKAGDGFTIVGGTIATALGNAISAAGGAILNQVSNIFSSISAGVASNIQFEKYEVQFGVLLKSTEAAKQRLQELAQFGANTPFDLPGVVEADKILQGFGLHSQESAQKFGYSGEQIRTIAGDVASGTGARFQDMALLIGKFSAGATGEAISRFQELGITTREELSKMGLQFSKSGELLSPLPQAMNVVLGLMKEKYGGMMQQQSATLDGMLSNFSDWKEGALRTLSAPIFDVFKQNLGGFLAFTTAHADQINAVLTTIGSVIADVLGAAFNFITNSVIPAFVAGWQMIAPAVETAMAVLQNVGAVFMELANQAMGWGENIINQLAGGMMNAAGTVIDILNQIGAIITDLLIPHSPPKLLPGLTAWGMGAINAYMAGWGQGDFSVFNGIGSAIENAIKQINTSVGSKNTNIASIMLGSQAAIADAINEIRNVGSVSEETFQKIIQAAGPAGPQVSGLVRAYLELERTTQDVSRAQAELNSVTEEYNAKLAPLQANLRAIQDKKQAIQDQERLKELQATVADESIDASKRQLAALEIQEIQARQQIRTTEQERDVAVDAAKAKLDAAKEQQAAAKAQVDQQTQLLSINKKQNDLIAEQTKAMESAGKAMGGAAGAMKGAANGMKPIAEAAENVNKAVEGAKTAINGFTSAATRLAQIATVGVQVRQVGAAFSSLTTAIDSMVKSAIPVFNNIINVVILTIRSIIAAISQNSGLITGTFSTAWNTILSVTSTVFNAVMNVVNAVLGVLVNLIKNYGTGMITTVILVWANISNAVTSVLSAVGNAVSVVFGQIATFINNNQSSIAATIAFVWNTIGAIVSGAVQIISAVVVTVFNAVSGFIQAHGAQIQTILTTAWNLIASIVTTSLNLILGIVTVVLAAINGNWSGAWATLQQVSAQFVMGIYAVIVNALNLIANFFGTSLSGIAATWSGAWQGVQGIASSIWESIKGTAQGFVSGLIDTIQGAVSGLQSAAQDGLDAILGVWNGFTNWSGIGSDIIHGIIKGVSSGVGALIDAVKNAASSALDAAKRALGIASPSKRFADEVGEPSALGILEGFMRAFPGVNINIIKGIATLMENVAKIAEDGAKALAVLSEFKGSSNTGLGAFLASIQDIATRFAALADELGGRVLGTANRFSESAGKVVELIKNAVESINALEDFIIPTKDSIGRFGYTLSLVVGNIAYIASFFQQKSIDSGAAFAKGAKDMLAIVKDAIEAFIEIPNVVDVSRDAVARFGGNLTLIVSMFVDIVRNWNSASVTTAATFAESAGKIIGIIGNAVEAFTKLSTISAVPLRAFGDFQVNLWQLLGYLHTLAQSWPTEAMDSMAVFGDGITKVIGFIGTALDNFVKLNDFQGIAERNITNFYLAMWNTMRYLHTLAQSWPKEAMSIMATFGDGVIKTISYIGTAIDNLNRLKDIQVVPERALNDFQIAMWNTLLRLHTLAQNFPSEAVSIMAVFGEGIGKAIGVISTAVEQFTKLRDFTGIPADAIQAFATGLTQTIQALANSAATIGSAATAAAKLLADGIGNSLDIIGKAVDAFTKLQEFKTIPQTTILAFVDTLWRVVEELEQASEYFTQAGYAAAKALNDGIGDSLSVIGKAVDGFTKLKDFQVVPQKTILAFVDTLGRVFEELVQASEYFNEAAYSAAKSLADGIGSSISVISTAIDQFAKLLDFKAPSKDAMTTFVNALKSTVSAMTNLVLPASEDIGVQLIQGIIKGIQSQVAALSKALDDAMGQALDSIKVTLGIASPSKVFEEQVGTNIAAGIASGMNKITEPNFGGLLAATDNFRMASVAMAANAPIMHSTGTYTEQYNVYANYKHQEESTIRDDLRMVHMLRGRR